MKKILICLGLIGSMAATAQDQAIQTSKEFNFELSDSYRVIDASSKIYMGYSGGLTAVKFNKEGMHIQYFTGTEKLNEKSHNLIAIPKNAVYEGDLKSDKTGYIFYSVWDKANTTEQLYVQRINLEEGVAEGTGERLIAVKGKVTGGDGNKFKFEESFDHSTYLIWYRKAAESRDDKKNNDVIGISVLDKDLKVMWTSDEKMPYTEARMNNLDYAVDSKGNAFILTEVMNEGEKKKFDKEGNPNFTIELITVTGNGASIASSDLNSSGKFILEAGFFEGPNEFLILAGYYSNKKKAIVDGAFISVLNKSGSQEDFKTYEIPSEILKQYTSDRQQRKIDKDEEQDDEDLGFANLRLREVIADKDGSIYMAGEKYYWKVKNIDRSQNEITYAYYYQDMLLIKIAPDGTLAFMKRIPKNQYALQTQSLIQFGGSSIFAIPSYRGDLGYKLMITEDHVYFAYLDNVKNLNLELNQTPKRHVSNKGGFLTSYQINKENGEVKKLSILDTRDAKGTELFQFNTERMVNIENNVIGLECYKKKKEDVMIRISIND